MAPRLRHAARRRVPLWPALLLARALGAGRGDHLPPFDCEPHFRVPEAPMHATDLNGVALRDVCLNVTDQGEHHVFVIGDWGGVEVGDGMVIPADRREPKFGADHVRMFVQGVDDEAQQRVARQMQALAAINRPDYFLNVGDNFYWSGIEGRCGSPPYQQIQTPGQWGPIFETMYAGDGIDGKPWLSVLGNHDYGGYSFLNAWDQQIGYTWGGAGSTGRWIMPAQYWRVKVWYPTFSVDYYFVDSNVFDARNPMDDQGHNMCSLEHNPTPATCGEQGPKSAWDCPHWFTRLWDAEIEWMEKNLAESVADWQVVVTHFPPSWGLREWLPLSKRYGIDLILTGHVHSQHIYGPKNPENALRPTVYAVTGGGGGITSEGVPDANGNDDEYGFLDVTLSKTTLVVQAISHGGLVRATVKVQQRPPNLDYHWRYALHKQQRDNSQDDDDVDEDAARAADPDRLQRCDGTPCPPEWLTGQVGVGGYYCPNSLGCRDGTQGPFQKDFCPGQCFIGDPPIKTLSTTTTTSLTETTTTMTSTTATTTTRTTTSTTSTAPVCSAGVPRCPEDWRHGVGGYWCPRTFGCRPWQEGMFSWADCPDQCYVGLGPTLPVPDADQLEANRQRAELLLQSFRSQYQEGPAADQGGGPADPPAPKRQPAAAGGSEDGMEFVMEGSTQQFQ